MPLPTIAPTRRRVWIIQATQTLREEGLPGLMRYISRGERVLHHVSDPQNTYTPPDEGRYYRP